MHATREGKLSRKIVLLQIVGIRAVERCVEAFERNAMRWCSPPGAQECVPALAQRLPSASVVAVRQFPRYYGVVPSRTPDVRATGVSRPEHSLSQEASDARCENAALTTGYMLCKSKIYWHSNVKALCHTGGEMSSVAPLSAWLATAIGSLGRMRLGILGDIHGYLPGSDRMCIDFAVHLTATLPVHAFLQVGDMCHYRSFARPVHWIYGNNDWPDVVRQVETGERPLRHLHHLKTGAVLTLSDSAEQVRIAGLNGAFDDLYYDLAPEAERPSKVWRTLSALTWNNVCLCAILTCSWYTAVQRGWATDGNRTTVCRRFVPFWMSCSHV